MKSLYLLFVVLLSTVAAEAQFTFTTNNGSITVASYNGSGSTVVIPSMVTGMPVTSIGEAAFNARFSVISVTIPNTVTNIGRNAFGYCTFLTSISIPDSVNYIGDWAFESCDRLVAITVGNLNASYSSVNGVLLNKSQTTLIQYPGGKAGAYVVPNTIRTIALSAFNSSAELTAVSIPATVTNIGDFAFNRCHKLTGITVDALNPSYRSIDGVLFDISQTTLIQYPGAKQGGYTVPSDVKRIATWAFAEASLSNVYIVGGVTNIGSGAFSLCFNLTNVVIQPGVRRIENQAFWYCTGLARIVIPSSVTNIFSQAFYHCTALTSVYFEGNAPYLGSLPTSVFEGDSLATIYYLPGTANWVSPFGGRPAALWNPLMQTGDMAMNQFGFTITGTSDIPILIEASTALVNPTWSPLKTCTLTNGSFYFSDSASTNLPTRFYRIRSP